MTCFFSHCNSLRDSSEGEPGQVEVTEKFIIMCDKDDDWEWIMKSHLQAVGIPRYSFGHRLQTQTLAVHMRPGAAALVWASSHRSDARQHRENQSSNPAERSSPLRPGRRHVIHWNYFQTEVNWISAGGGEVDLVEVRIPKKVKRGRSSKWWNKKKEKWWKLKYKKKKKVRCWQKFTKVSLKRVQWESP